MDSDIEIRAALELRADQERRLLSGIALKYGDTAQLAGGLQERFEAGAFADLSDVRLDVQHDRGRILTRTGSGLVLEDSADALRFSAELPETREADDTLRLVSANILRGASIGFRSLEDRLEGRVRVVAKAALGAVSVVDNPAYGQSVIEARWAEPRQLARFRTWYLL